MRVRFVLVEPREAGNVGAAARAMKNFGFTDLAIVGETPPLQPVAEWWASGAGDLVERAARPATLADAVSEAQLVVATTSSRERPVGRPLSPMELAQEAAALGEEGMLALVFGREDRGLTSEEIALCGRAAVIPTSDLHPTMNLAQSVAVFAWELSKAMAMAPAREERSDLPSAAELERLHETARALLVEAGFLHENNPDRIYADLRALVARAAPDRRELAILMGMARQVRWRFEHGR